MSSLANENRFLIALKPQYHQFIFLVLDLARRLGFRSKIVTGGLVAIAGEKGNKDKNSNMDRWGG